MTKIEQTAIQTAITLFIDGKCDLDEFIKKLSYILDSLEAVNTYNEELKYRNKSLWLEFPKATKVNTLNWNIDEMQIKLEGKLINGEVIAFISGPIRLIDIYNYKDIEKHIIENLWKDLYDELFTRFLKIP